MRPRRITTRLFRTRRGTVPGRGPAGRLWASRCAFGSSAHPLEEREQVAVLVERCEPARAEVGLLHPVPRDRVEHVLRAQLLAELVDALDLDAAARRPGDERLRAGANGPP